jgi:predicted nucleic acid-binding protein
MAQKNECYVDTSAFIAFLDKSDSHHPFFRRLFSDQAILVTSALVAAEGHAWFLRRYDQIRAIQFLAFLSELPTLAMRPFGSGEFDSASRIIRNFADQKLTLADAHGLSIMKERHIGMCWSTDRNLGLTGVPLVIRGA